jgi:hypothetical protein
VGLVSPATFYPSRNPYQLMTPEPDLFPHATAQAPELERARLRLSQLHDDLNNFLEDPASPDAEIEDLRNQIETAKDRVTQLEAEAMRKEGR